METIFNVKPSEEEYSSDPIYSETGMSYKDYCNHIDNINLELALYWVDTWLEECNKPEPRTKENIFRWLDKQKTYINFCITKQKSLLDWAIKSKDDSKYRYAIWNTVVEAFMKKYEHPDALSLWLGAFEDNPHLCDAIRYAFRDGLSFDKLNRYFDYLPINNNVTGKDIYDSTYRIC